MKSFKCVLVGNGGVGKTTYVRSLVADYFQVPYVATLGVEVHPYVLNEATRFNFWDCAGVNIYGGLKQGYYIQADCGMVCFDLNDPASFHEALNWMEALAKQTTNLVIVGFKSDLPAKISKADIWAMSDDLNLPYFEVSTKNQEGLKKPLIYLEQLLNP